MTEAVKLGLQNSESELDVDSILDTPDLMTQQLNNHPVATTTSEIDVNFILPKVEASHLRNVSDAQEIAEQFNLLLQEEDMEPTEIVEDLLEGADNSALMERLETKVKQSWSSKKRSTIHHNLHQAVMAHHHLRSRSQPQITPQSSLTQSASNGPSNVNGRHSFPHHGHGHGHGHQLQPLIGSSPRTSNSAIVSKIMDVVRLPKQHTKTLSSRALSIGRRATNTSSPSLHDRVESNSNHTPTRFEQLEEDEEDEHKTNGLQSSSSTTATATNDPTAPSPAGYGDVPFHDYTPQHLAQFIGDSARSEFAANGHCSELRDRVFGAEIDGAKLRANLNADFIKNTLQTEAHKFKKATVQYLVQCGRDGLIKDSWPCSKVLEFLYFAESMVMKRAIVDLQIDGAAVEAMNVNAFLSTMKAKGIKAGMAREYFKKIDRHRTDCAAAQRTLSHPQSAPQLQSDIDPNGIATKPFIEYTADDVAQCLHADIRSAFTVEKGGDLRGVVMEHKIDGAVFVGNLNEEYIKSTFKKRFKKVTIQYILETAPSAVTAACTVDGVVEYLYFAECAVVQRAILELQLDGQTLAAMDIKEFKSKLKGKDIKSGMATKYWDKIVSLAHSLSLSIYISIFSL